MTITSPPFSDAGAYLYIDLFLHFHIPSHTHIVFPSVTTAAWSLIERSFVLFW